MNRPFGAVDVAANLKGAVPKATTQKILVALAEKGEVVQKTYGTYRSVTKKYLTFKTNRGKTSFFVTNQASIDSFPAGKLTELELECKTIEESNSALAVEIRAITAGSTLKQGFILVLTFRKNWQNSRIIRRTKNSMRRLRVQKRQ